MPGSLIIFILLSTLIVFGFIATMRYLEIYKQSTQGDGPTDNSLGTGELRGMIQEAVLDAIQPVEERLDQMEVSLRQLPEAKSDTERHQQHLPEDPSAD